MQLDRHPVIAEPVSPLNLANLFTFSRILLAAPVAVLFLSEYWVAGLILSWVAGLTDFFDGLVARALNQESRLGALLDPIADKILIGVIVVCLLLRNVLPIWFVAVVVARDVMIMAGSMALLRREVHPHSASYLSKFNTCFLGLALTVAILGRAQVGWFWTAATPYFLIVAAALTVASGAHYIYVGLKLYRHQDQ
ncbi:MAG: CDP-alcohol phosphatidyltransferase family protein [Proteobacteria bacterium]|nr:CDP-alcohol phosphatidyltransferase family protein [Pseudomonadota bacterium]MBU1742992.1 CDP-alcohol phosphatidyltransferase family protein [Pseudomonadota bacterium]